MDWNNLIASGVVTTLLTAASMFIESLPDILYRFSGWVMER